MTGNDLIKAIGSASDENLLLSEEIPAQKRKSRMWILASAAAAIIILGLGIIAITHFKKKPIEDMHTALVTTAYPTMEATSRPTTAATAEPTESPSAQPTQDTSSAPPPVFSIEGFMVHGHTTFYDSYSSKEELTAEYVRGGKNSDILRNLFSMRSGEFYFAPANDPENAELMMIVPTYGTIAFLYQAPDDPTERYAFEWIARISPEEVEWLIAHLNSGIGGFKLTEGYYITDYYYEYNNNASYKEVYLIRDSYVFRAAMPVDCTIDEIKSFVDPVMVILPDPDPSCVDTLKFKSIDECLAAISENTSDQSVLAGLDGIYTLKKDEVVVTGVTINRDSVVLGYANESGWSLYILTMFRQDKPDSDWLLEKAKEDPLYSFSCDLDVSASNRIYLVYDTIGHPNLYWIEEGKAFRLYMYFGEEETDLSQESVLELCHVLLLTDSD